jgi:hypothetical protein
VNPVGATQRMSNTFRCTFRTYGIWKSALYGKLHFYVSNRTGTRHRMAVLERYLTDSTTKWADIYFTGLFTSNVINWNFKERMKMSIGERCTVAGVAE